MRFWGLFVFPLKKPLGFLFVATPTSWHLTFAEAAVLPSMAFSVSFWLFLEQLSCALECRGRLTPGVARVPPYPHSVFQQCRKGPGRGDIAVLHDTNLKWIRLFLDGLS